ncbi:MAG: adaptor protein MecA [Firmicutes bacterium]|nr:adaptor protein MecA [Bacillota bacterium]
MKSERISKNQVRFTLNRADLKARQLKISDLSYGSEKAKALFDDMMMQAAAEFGFDVTAHPVMIEAIPISEDSLMITMTQVRSHEDLLALFRSNVPGADMGPDEVDQRIRQQEEPPAEAPVTETVMVYTFDSFDTILDASRTVSPSLRLRNQLYRDAETGAYHLLVTFSRQTRTLRYVLTALTEYASDVSRDPLRIAYIREHDHLSVHARALQKLAAMETM